MKQYDLLLVVGYFRSVSAYLSIIRHLSQKLTIGVLAIPVALSLREKTGAASELFMRLCVEFGAQIVELGDAVQTRLMIVQQFPYSDADADAILASVSSRRNVGYMTLAMAGIEQHDRYLEQFNIRKVYSLSRRFTEFLLEKRQAVDRYTRVQVVEIGLPFARYPIFPEFEVDWLIAAPTLFSFHDEHGKQSFLKTVLKLLEEIPKTDSVAYKPHNGNTMDYFVPRSHYALARSIYRFCALDNILEVLSRRLPGSVGWHLDRVLTSVLHLRVLRRAKRMSGLTPYSDLAIEAFLPGVRKGVIGGLSNTIWGTLYFGLPFYNCVNPALRQGESRLQNRKSDNLLDLNLQYFGVNYCHGNIREGDRGESIITPDDRRGDLMAEIRRELTD